jgi:hypothetical protein
MHEADDLLQAVGNIRIGDIGRRARGLACELRFAKALHFGVTGETNEMLV